MSNILILGAGRSSSALINYLLEQAKKNNWKVTVADASKETAEKKVAGHPNGRAVELDINNWRRRHWAIKNADIIISLLPAHLHHIVAIDCVKQKKHLVTASYVSEEVYELEQQIHDAGIVFMGEMGMDPGIDHMSAMQNINKIKLKGGKMLSLSSYGGGLIAPESDTNPWHYKFTWNPRNVVLAGHGTAQYMEQGEYKYIPYNRVFTTTKKVEVPEVGTFEAYANRDSLFYKEIYKISQIPNILRATLRYPGYCRAWNAFVKLGWTDDTYELLESKNITYRQLVEAYLMGKTKEKDDSGSTKRKLAAFLKEDPESEVMQKLEWLGIFEDKKISMQNVTPAQVLQRLLEKKWSLQPGDRDMVIMQHEFDYELKKEKRRFVSSMMIKGEDETHTAMSKLVGLPLGIFVNLLLKGKIKVKGIQIPVLSSIYTPVLDELADYGIEFKDYEVEPEKV